MQHRPFPRFRALAGLAVALLAFAGCLDSTPSEDAAAETHAISAAASLQSALDQISEKFRAANPQVEIFNNS